MRFDHPCRDHTQDLRARKNPQPKSLQRFKLHVRQRTPAHESNLFNWCPPLDHKLVRMFRPGSSIMPQKLMDVLRLGRCSHEFSWPRRSADGQYYQVCLLCAAEYKYDWATMRRTERVPLSAEDPASRRRTREKKPSWVPRARRLRLHLPLRYRVKNLSTWSEGTILNISQSGVLFDGAAELPVNALVEMVFDMPEEISGQKNSNVLCQGRIIRSKEGRGEQASSGLAATILDYKFLHKN